MEVVDRSLPKDHHGIAARGEQGLKGSVGTISLGEDVSLYVDVESKPSLSGNIGSWVQDLTLKLRRLREDPWGGRSVDVRENKGEDLGVEETPFLDNQ